MSKLIVVSNRVTPPVKGESAAGGLSVALAAALRQYSGIWFGWSGRTVPTFTGEATVANVDGVTTATIDLEEADYQEYYNGYANGTLWPLFHYRIDLTAYDRSFGQGYERVNRKFAESLAPFIEPDDLVWVHDYHLIPLGRELRRLGVEAPMGFFLHIPWPAPQVLTTLPRHQRLVESMFSYDLIGLQTTEWLWAFEAYVLGEAGGRRLPDGRLSAFGRAVKAKAFPIGLDVEEFGKLVYSQAADRAYDRIAAHSVFRDLILGVERLDYSKGLEERLYGIERFLADNPTMAGKVQYLEVAPSSREEVGAYQDLRCRVESLCGRINAAWAEMDWAPIQYVNRTFSRAELAGLYRAAKVAMVTPLRDGMNLVAKEYVAAQDPADPGVLILSRFAGAAGQMKDALIVNPYSREELSEALSRALAMERGERVRRWERLMAGVRSSNVKVWRDEFVRDLGALKEPAPISERPVPATASMLPTEPVMTTDPAIGLRPRPRPSAELRRPSQGRRPPLPS
jgi:trehalose 6-phosphate synthase